MLRSDSRMNVRAYTDADLDALRAMHAAQGFAYALPDLSDPLFLVRQVVEEDGRPRMAALLRLTAEAYLLADPAMARRASAGNGLGRCTKPPCAGGGARGLADVQAFVPPRVARAFGRRLETLGWRRDPWSCYTRLV